MRQSLDDARDEWASAFFGVDIKALRGSQPEQGGSMEMVECPCCARGGCVVCHGSGVVKKLNLDRAREAESVEHGWSDAALRRLMSLALVTPDDGIDWEWMASHGDG